MKKIIVFLLFIVLAVTIVGCQTNQENNTQEEGATFTYISAEEAKVLIETNENLTVLDVSAKYEEGHLPNAINIYIDDLEMRIGELDKSKPILVYCHFDSVSMRGAQILIDNEFMEVYRLEGNYKAWLDAGYEVEKTKVIQSEYEDVKVEEAIALIEMKEDLVILDVSSLYEEGHLPKAINIYIEELKNNIDMLDKSKPILVYCHVDSASIKGAKILKDNEFEEVYRLEGNYAAWYDNGYLVEVEIKAVGNYTGNGFATRSFLDGKFKHKVEANIGDPAEGKFYEGWLVDLPAFFSTGKMEKVNGKYVLEYTSEEDSRLFKAVVITEETEANGLDGKPEVHVLEGKFK